MIQHLPTVIAAPMAGGPSTPELVNAVQFGFLALGTCSVDDARDQMRRTRGSYGVNLFCPQQETPDRHAVQAMADELGVEVPVVDLSNGFEAKFAAALSAIDECHGPAAVSTMFGSLTAEQIDALHARGVEAWATVTNPTDADTASRRGNDRLIVQGPKAGGHRGTWTIHDEPDPRPLPDLLQAVAAVTDLPLVAAGGARSSADVARLLAAGACSVSCGSAFLLADEAGTSLFNRELLAAGGSSISTRAFSGRYARGLATAFTDAHPNLPPLYPHLNPMLKDRREEVSYAYCLVGENSEALIAGPAREIERSLLPSRS